MRVNPIPPVRVIPVPDQALFADEDFRALERRIEAARKGGADSQRAIQFNKGWLDLLRAAITESSRMVALATKRHLAERDARIAALMTAVELRDRQIERHSEHLQRLENRIQFLERHTQAKP